jgi:hypothetical protein
MNYILTRSDVACTNLGQGSRPLPYDLNLLYDYVKKTGGRRLVIAFRDSESFDQALLGDIVSLIRYGA